MIAAATAAVGSVTLLADCWHHGWGGPWFLLGPLVWILVIVGIIWLIRGRAPWRRRGWRSSSDSPMQTLERRFALGEIDGEEYQRRRSILEGRQDE